LRRAWSSAHLLQLTLTSRRPKQRAKAYVRENEDVGQEVFDFVVVEFVVVMVAVVVVVVGGRSRGLLTKDRDDLK
jgi:hypothetical protein